MVRFGTIAFKQHPDAFFFLNTTAFESKAEASVAHKLKLQKIKKEV